MCAFVAQSHLRESRSVYNYSTSDDDEFAESVAAGKSVEPALMMCEQSSLLYDFDDEFDAESYDDDSEDNFEDYEDVYEPYQAIDSDSPENSIAQPQDAIFAALAAGASPLLELETPSSAPHLGMKRKSVTIWGLATDDSKNEPSIEENNQPTTNMLDESKTKIIQERQRTAASILTVSCEDSWICAWGLDRTDYDDCEGSDCVPPIIQRQDSVFCSRSQNMYWSSLNQSKTDGMLLQDKEDNISVLGYTRGRPQRPEDYDKMLSVWPLVSDDALLETVLRRIPQQHVWSTFLLSRLPVLPDEDYEVRFVARSDTPPLPNQLIKCRISESPSIKKIVAALFNRKTDAIIHLSSQVEVTLKNISGDWTNASFNSIPFADGFYYFKDISYAGSSGIWTLALSAQSTINRRATIASHCHCIDVQVHPELSSPWNVQCRRHQTAEAHAGKRRMFPHSKQAQMAVKALSLTGKTMHKKMKTRQTRCPLSGWIEPKTLCAGLGGLSGQDFFFKTARFAWSEVTTRVRYQPFYLNRLQAHFGTCRETYINFSADGLDALQSHLRSFELTDIQFLQRCNFEALESIASVHMYVVPFKHFLPMKFQLPGLILI